MKKPVPSEVEAPVAAKKRGRPRKGELREAKPGKLDQQQGKSLAQLLKELPREVPRYFVFQEVDFTTGFSSR